VETTERVVEAYVRYLKGWFTLPNIKCDAKREIDLHAIDPNGRGRKARYHIESGVSISSVYGKHTAKPYHEAKLKSRLGQAAQRRTLGYFKERKFGHPAVLDKLAEYRFKDGNYTKVIVSWGGSRALSPNGNSQPATVPYYRLDSGLSHGFPCRCGLRRTPCAPAGDRMATKGGDCGGA
jgi:hypothetical protein